MDEWYKVEVEEDGFEMLAPPFLGCVTFGKLLLLYLSFRTCEWG